MCHYLLTSKILQPSTNWPSHGQQRPQLTSRKLIESGVFPYQASLVVTSLVVTTARTKAASSDELNANKHHGHRHFYQVEVPEGLAHPPAP